MAEEIDDLMQTLLEQLGSMGDEQLLQEPEPIKKESAEEPPIIEESSELEDLKPSDTVLTPVSELIPTDFRSVEDQQLSKNDEISVPSTGINVAKYLSKLDEVTESVLAACDADRKETQNVINTYRTAIDNAIDSGEEPLRMWVDGLVKAVEVKAGINTTAVKMMEATAKMLAATKSSIQINQQFNNPTSLTDLLDEPITDEDEY
jgi:hypothetical protein